MKGTKRSFHDSSGSPAASKKPTALGGIPEYAVRFKEILISAGLVFGEKDQPDALTCSSVEFQKNIMGPCLGDQDLESFLMGLQHYWMESSRLVYTLLPLSTINGDTSHSMNQISLVQILLRIRNMQVRLAGLLIEKLAELSLNGHADSDTNMCCLILTQLYWVPSEDTAEAILSKLMEVLPVCAIDMQQDIITRLPDIFGDTFHETISLKLREMLQKNINLAAAILETFSNLTLNQDCLDEIVEKAIGILPSVAAECVPVVVKFIQQSVSSKNCMQAVLLLRSKLMLDSLCPTSALSNGQSTLTLVNRNINQTCLVLTLETLKNGILYLKAVANTWTKVLSSMQPTELIKDLDVIVLVILLQAQRRTAEAVMRRLVTSGMLKQDLLMSTLQSHSKFLQQYYKELLSVAASWLVSATSNTKEFGVILFKVVFLEMEPFVRQETVSMLVSIITSSSGLEVAAALRVLDELSLESPALLLPYLVFIKSLLDSFDAFELAHVKTLFTVLGRLHFSRNALGSLDLYDPELHIVIQKKMSKADLRLKQYGLMAALMMVQCLATRTKPSDSALVKQKIVESLEMIQLCAAGHPELLAFYYDELSTLVSARLLTRSVVDWIFENIVDDFQAQFVVDTNKKDVSFEFHGDIQVQAAPMFDLNNLEESIAFNILPVTYQVMCGTRGCSTNRLLYVLPMFRLLCSCETFINDGKFENIDALLGCPLMLPPASQIMSFKKVPPQERNVICTSLCYSISWFRECINSFSSLPSAEVKAKLHSRLRSLVQLHAWLERCRRDTPNFTPPRMTTGFFGSSSFKETNTSQASSSKSKVPKKRKKKITTEVDTAAEDLEEMVPDNDDALSESGTVTSSSVHDEDFYSNLSIECLREFDVDALRVFLVNEGVETHQQPDTEGCCQLGDTEKLYLISDLETKLKVVYRSKPKGFGREKRVLDSSRAASLSEQSFAKLVVSMSPFMSRHLQRCSDYFKSQLDVNDGVLDGAVPDLESETYLKLFGHITSSICIFLSWLVTQSHDEGLLREFLLALLQRSPAEATPLNDLLSFTISLFRGMSTPTLSIATALVQFVECLAKAPCAGLQSLEAIAEMADDLLKQSFPLTGCSPRNYRESVELLLRLSLSYVPQPLNSLDCLIQGLLMEITRDGITESRTYPLINRDCLAVVFRSIFSALCTEFRKTTEHISEQNMDLLMEKLMQLTHLFQLLVNVVKINDSRPVVSTTLKFSGVFLELFLKKVMPFFDRNLRLSKSAVQNILKSLQPGTRFLHHICRHVKIEKDVTLTNYIPSLKKTLESLVFRVKVMLALNNCHSAFWLGNLKNRDIHGNEVASQSSTGPSSQVSVLMSQTTGQMGSSMEDSLQTLDPDHIEDTDDDVPSASSDEDSGSETGDK